MDTKAPSSLDPKLKEVYDRVMGSANPKSSPPPQATPQPSLSATPVAKPVAPGLPPLPTNGGLSASPFAQSGHAIPPAPAASGPDMTKTTPVTPPKPAPTTPSTPTPDTNHTATSPLGKPVVDYAALAAKYATPTPPVSALGSIHPGSAVVTPSTTTYGVVNTTTGTTGTAKPQEKEKKEGSSKKKLLLVVGIPIALLVYAVVWIVIFHIDVMALLPLPK